MAGAALRVADVTRVLKDKRLRGDKGGEVAKLFARHFKLEEHIAYLKKTKLAAAAGTPGRLGKLLCDSGASPRLIRVARVFVWPRWLLFLPRHMTYLLVHFCFFCRCIVNRTIDSYYS